MGTPATDRNRQWRARQTDKTVFLYMPPATHELLLELVHKAGPLATIKRTVIDLIEQQRFRTPPP